VNRLIGMVVFFGALLAGLAGLSALFYLAAGGLAYVFAEYLGAPPSFGAAIANVLTLMLVVMMISGSLLTVAERKWSAMIQNRIGANRIKVFGSALGGIPYLAADALKMLTKEGTQPRGRTRVLFEFAPALVRPGVRAVRDHPGRPGDPLGSMFEGAAGALGSAAVALQVASIDTGLLYIFAISSLAVYGTSLAGGPRTTSSAPRRRRASSPDDEPLRCRSACRSSARCSPIARCGSTRWSSLRDTGHRTDPHRPAPAAHRLPHLLYERVRRDQARPLRPPRGRERDRRLLPRVLGHEVRDDVPRRVPRDRRLRRHHHRRLPGRLAPAGGQHRVAARLGDPALVRRHRRRRLPGEDDPDDVAAAHDRWLLPRFRFDQIQKFCWKILLPAALTNIFVTAAVLLIDPSMRLLAWIGVATLVIIAAITAAVGRAPAREEHAAAHAAAGH
jgi:hypothetical protein